MAKFSVALKRTLSTTSAVGTVNGASSNARRGYLYYWSVGSESTPADANIELEIRRCSTSGVGGTSVTPVPLDSGDTQIAATATQGVYTTEPTYIANSDLFREVFNQKYGAKWYAPPGGEIVYPGSPTNSNGFAALTPVCTAGTPLITFECHVDEK